MLVVTVWNPKEIPVFYLRAGAPTKFNIDIPKMLVWMMYLRLQILAIYVLKTPENFNMGS